MSPEIQRLKVEMTPYLSYRVSFTFGITAFEKFVIVPPAVTFFPFNKQSDIKRSEISLGAAGGKQEPPRSSPCGSECRGARGGTVLRPVEMKVGVTSRYDSRGASDGAVVTVPAACASTEGWLIANPAQARGVPGSQGTFVLTPSSSTAWKRSFCLHLAKKLS